MIEAIVAMDDQGGVGFEGQLPWPHNPEDLKWFQQITKGKVCIVGYNTSLKLPKLPGRSVVVMDRMETPEDIISIYPSLVVIGGPATYKQWQQYIDRFYISRIRGEYEADTHLKEWAPWILES